MRKNSDVWRIALTLLHAARFHVEILIKEDFPAINDDDITHALSSSIQIPTSVKQILST